jgi:hypothetical protein
MSETEIMDTGQQLENKLMHNHTKLIHILSIAFEIKNNTKLKGSTVGRNQFFCCQPDFLVQNIYGNIHFIHTTLHPPPMPYQHTPILNFLRPNRMEE